MSDIERDEAGHDPTGAPEDTTPTGEPAVDGEDPSGDAELRGDPETGSTEEDPAVDDTGLPPAGRDPMAGESPSS